MEEKKNTQFRTHVITCQGFDVDVYDKNGELKNGMKPQFAEGHEKLRLVSKAELTNVKRCKACQAEYLKMRKRSTANSRANSRRAKTLRGNLDEIRSLKANKEVWNSLSAEQRQELQHIETVAIEAEKKMKEETADKK